MKKTLLNFLFVFQIIAAGASAQNTIVLQPDAVSGKDAEIFSCGPCGYRNLNFATKRDFDAITWTNDGNTSKVRSLIQFDLSAIPAGAIITDARLSLYFNPSSTEGSHFSSFVHDNTSVLKRITTSWSENTVTWNNQPSTTPVHQVTLAHTTSGSQNYLNINVKNMVKDMLLNPSTSFGFMLKLKKEHTFNKLIFASSDHPDASLHPKLVITYTMPAPVAGDETSEESVLRTTESAVQNAVRLAPNPAKEEVKLMISAREDNIAEIHVINAIGKEVYNQKQPVTKGDNSFMMPCEGWGRGLYYFLVKISGEAMTRKLIVE